MRSLFVVLTTISLLAACSEPPPSAYVGGVRSAALGNEGVSLGKNASGETCNQIPSGDKGAVDVFCGAWLQPAARIRIGEPRGGASLASIATASTWREAIDLRFACGAPADTTILGGDPTVVLRCTRRIGGWPQVALVAEVNGRVYQADGIMPTLPVIERSIAVLSGRTGSSTAVLPQSAADAMLAGQLAARAFSADDIGEYQKLMALGARANLAENFATAETAYRAALVLQQRVLGRDHPDTVNAMMHLALQLSDQGRFANADPLFKQADALAPRASDLVARARLQHYRGLHALNQEQPKQALAFLDTAKTGYIAHVPPESLQAQPTFRPISAGLAGDLAAAPSDPRHLDRWQLEQVFVYHAYRHRLATAAHAARAPAPAGWPTRRCVGGSTTSAGGSRRCCVACGQRVACRVGRSGRADRCVERGDGADAGASVGA